MSDPVSRRIARDVEHETAVREGEKAGYDPSCIASMCPYAFAQASLRLAWFDGFSQGRVKRQVEQRDASR